ncbi:MAG: baseplate J/gp47 family protein [Lachnospiraceae bacterium]|nr:baseplate J/gp47 family protein [Lachnospiraceae bacterium]
MDVAILSDVQKIHHTVPVYGGKAFLGGDGYDVSTLKVDGMVPETDYTVSYENDLMIISLLGDFESFTSIEIDVDVDLAGRVLIVPIMEGGKIPAEDVLQKVYDVCSADDVRPMTDKVIVQPPTQIEYEIDVTYYTTPENESDCIKTIEGKDGAIDRFIEWQDTKMGRDINPDKLRALCLSPDGGSGCTRIMVTSPEYTELKETEVAKCKRISIKHVLEV